MWLTFVIMWYVEGYCKIQLNTCIVVGNMVKYLLSEFALYIGFEFRLIGPVS
jgi:hypothetical protein